MSSFEKDSNFAKLNNSNLISSMNASLHMNGPSSANKRSNISQGGYKKESLSKQIQKGLN